MDASRTQLSTGRFRSSVPWLAFDPSSSWLALDLDSCAICDIDMLNIFSRSQNSVNLNKSVPAKIDRLSKVPDWDQFVWRYILKRMRSDMFGVVSFPPLWNLFLALTVRYFTQMCALKILKTLIWLPLYICPKSPFSSWSCVNAFPALSVTQVGPVKGPVGSGWQCKQTFSQGSWPTLDCWNTLKYCLYCFDIKVHQWKFFKIPSFYLFLHAVKKTIGIAR